MELLALRVARATCRITPCGVGVDALVWLRRRLVRRLEPVEWPFPWGASVGWRPALAFDRPIRLRWLVGPRWLVGRQWLRLLRTRQHRWPVARLWLAARLSLHLPQIRQRWLVGRR